MAPALPAGRGGTQRCHLWSSLGAVSVLLGAGASLSIPFRGLQCRPLAGRSHPLLRGLCWLHWFPLHSEQGLALLRWALRGRRRTQRSLSSFCTPLMVRELQLGSGQRRGCVQSLRHGCPLRSGNRYPDLGPWETVTGVLLRIPECSGLSYPSSGMFQLHSYGEGLAERGKNRKTLGSECLSGVRSEWGF